MSFWIRSYTTGEYIDADNPDPNRPVPSQILYDPTPDLNCPGSGQPPRIADGKPCCRVCGVKFKWQEMEDRVRFVPEH